MDGRTITGDQRERDLRAFDDLYVRSVAQVTAYFRRRIHCDATVADLTAETFTRAWANRARFDPAQGSAHDWTMGIAANVCRHWTERSLVARRRSSVVQCLSSSIQLDDVERIDVLTDNASLRRSLDCALHAMSPLLREAVVLRIALDLPYDNVADRLGCSVVTARARVHRGLAWLLNALGAQRRVEDDSAAA